MRYEQDNFCVRKSFFMTIHGYSYEKSRKIHIYAIITKIHHKNYKLNNYFWIRFFIVKMVIK